MASWLQKKMLRLGPGSPGKTAEVLAKNYLSFRTDGDATPEEAFRAIVGQRVMAWRMGNVVPRGVAPDTLERVIQRSSGDLPTLAFFLMYLEAEVFRNNIAAQRDTFEAATEVMYESVSSIAPEAVSKSLVEFQTEALDFTRQYNYL